MLNYKLLKMIYGLLPVKLLWGIVFSVRVYNWFSVTDNSEKVVNDSEKVTVWGNVTVSFVWTKDKLIE